MAAVDFLRQRQALRFGGRYRFVPAFDQGLGGVEYLLADNGRVAPCHKILRNGAFVSHFLSWEIIGGVSLLQNGVSGIPLIPQNIADHAGTPAGAVISFGNSQEIEMLRDFFAAIPRQETVEDDPDRFGFLGIDHQSSVFQPVAEGGFAGVE